MLIRVSTSKYIYCSVKIVTYSMACVHLNERAQPEEDTVQIRITGNSIHTLTCILKVKLVHVVKQQLKWKRNISHKHTANKCPGNWTRKLYMIKLQAQNQQFLKTTNIQSWMRTDFHRKQLL